MRRMKLICFSLMPLFLILIGGETVLRIFEPQWMRCVRTRACPAHDHVPIFLTQQPSNFSLENREPLFVYHPRYFWWPRPNVRGTFWSTPNVRTNSLGLRDDEREYPGRGRTVLILGDSVVWGSLVEESQRFGEIAEELLGTDPGYEDISIVNGGVLGFSSYQVLTYLRDEALETFEPTIVVLCVGINDNWPHHQSDSQTFQRAMSFPNRVRRLMLRSDFFLFCDRYMRELMILVRTGRNPEGLSFFFQENSTGSSVLRNDPFQSEANMHAAIRSIRKFGAEPIIILEDIRDLQPAGFDALAFRIGRNKFKELARDQDVTVLEIEAIRNVPYSLERNEYLMDFCHLHPRAHEIVAGWLADAIKEKLPALRSSSGE